MEYRTLGKTGLNVSAVVYGGIVSAGVYDDRVYPQWGQEESDKYVAWAVEQGINYFDVAPTYGNAQEQLGNSLVPYRNQINLACKTKERSREVAERELEESMKLLHTDHFEVYQLHVVKSMEDVEAAFAPGGVMELMRELKESGVAKNIGFTAHSEAAGLAMIERYDFDTVMFPLNWMMNLGKGMGNELLRKAKEHGMGVLGMKSMVERKWLSPEERYSSPYPKSWCKPIDVEEEAFGMAAMRYALSLGADVLVPPGNFASFQFAVDHIGACLEQPYAECDAQLLREKLPGVAGLEFYDIQPTITLSNSVS
ncbi:MAG: aldo/keto reductase [Lachnospiraceae bacterium]|nr:aldo/keto reductase [Lachnospiraceae bacterium]